VSENLKALGCKFVYSDTPLDLSKGVKPNHSQLVTNHPANSCKSLDDLKQLMLNFTGCALKATAMNTVFADGNPKSPIMLIGEAPGADEDMQGLPFVGQSGQLLNKILLSIGFKREDVYIANIVPWRPPGNRTPTNEEVAICQPFIEKHIELITPKILILLGGIAAKTLLKTNEGISKLRGRFLDYTLPTGANIQCLATFHPAYLLRSPGQKAQAWQDMLRVKINLEKQHA
jgi:uracil-DNA glycosylase family 4